MRMLRLLAILILVAAGLPRFVVGTGVPSEAVGQRCAAPPCAQRAVGEAGAKRARKGCCGVERADAVACPMSGGPCRCGATPDPVPVPVPETPLPGSERGTPTALPDAAARVLPSLAADTDPLSVCSLVVTLSEGMSYNEVRAFLGSWRT